MTINGVPEQIYIERLAMQMRIVQTEIVLLTRMLDIEHSELYRDRGVHGDDETAATQDETTERSVPTQSELPF